MTVRPRPVRLCLLGFGSVARALCDLLAARERQLAERYGLRALVSAVGTRHGSLVAPDGLPPHEVLARAGAAGRLPEPPRPADELLAASRAEVLVELTVMEHGAAPAATAHIAAALARGMDVVTANKGPIAWSWPRLRAAAAAAGRRIRFESTVMDGLPVFSLLDAALPDCRLLGFDAVLNCTTNAIIEAMARGASRDDALGQLRAAGVVEADPAHDLDGWDAACKAAALANVAMDASMTPAGVERVALRDVAPERIARAWADGRRLRLVTSVWRETPVGVGPGAGAAAPAGPAGFTTAAGPVRARMRAVELDIGHPLACIGAEALGAVLHTDLMNDVLVCELQGRLAQTAYGVYADLLHLCTIR
jgi:homoserine dehydrogenase